MSLARPVQPLLALGLLLAAGSALAAPAPPGTAPDVVAAAEKEGSVVIYSTTDAVYAAPVLKEFKALYPRIAVEYDDMNTTEVYNRFVSEAAAGSRSADVLWSSAMDLQLKLAADGYALQYASPEVPKLPAWAHWKDQAFGTTYEPIAFVYNKRLLKEDEIPRSHADLVRLLQARPERFRGKVTSYDPERSGVGYLLITQDARVDPRFQEALKAYGRVGLKLYPATGVMLERIASGEHLVGFNMFGSYALARQKKSPGIGIVYPSDYTLVMSRIALVPKAARHPNAAKVFLDFLLSGRGQDAISRAELFAVRSDVTGDATIAALQKALGPALKPIPVDPEILQSLDPARRVAFLDAWQKALGTR